MRGDRYQPLFLSCVVCKFKTLTYRGEGVGGEDVHALKVYLESVWNQKDKLSAYLLSHLTQGATESVFSQLPQSDTTYCKTMAKSFGHLFTHLELRKPIFFF